MGATAIESDDEGPNPYSDKTVQTAVQPSMAACVDVIEELKSARPSGTPLLSLAAPGQTGLDLHRLLFKQANEAGGLRPDEATDPNAFEIGHMRPGIYGHVGDRTNETTDITEAEALVEKPDYFTDMKDVFGNSTYFDMVRNHNQVLSVPEGKTIAEIMGSNGEHEDGYHGHSVNPDQLDSATRAIQAKPDQATTLFNFDSHSDMWMGAVHDQNESIAQWVNKVLQNNPNVNEVYWVIPKDFKANPELRKDYFEHDGSIPDGDNVFVHAQRDMTLYLDKNSGALIPEKPEDYSDKKYRPIELRKRTLDELPDFAGRRTAVSIDLDFFDNRGYDTAYQAAVNYTADAGFREFVQTMKDRNIRPEYTTVSASPEYVRAENTRDLMRFSALVGEATKAPTDAIAVPRQNSVYGAEDGHTGIQVDRKNVAALQLTNALFNIDAQTVRPNDSVNLHAPSAELAEAIKATRAAYGVGSDDEARAILAKLDSADGNENGTLEFEAIEALLVRVCESTNESQRRLKKGIDSADEKRG